MPSPRKNFAGQGQRTQVAAAPEGCPDPGVDDRTAAAGVCLRLRYAKGVVWLAGIKTQEVEEENDRFVCYDDREWRGPDCQNVRKKMKAAIMEFDKFYHMWLANDCERDYCLDMTLIGDTVRNLRLQVDKAHICAK